jgi:hypothetical protein
MTSRRCGWVVLGLEGRNSRFRVLLVADVDTAFPKTARIPYAMIL